MVQRNLTDSEADQLNISAQAQDYIEKLKHNQAVNRLNRLQASQPGSKENA